MYFDTTHLPREQRIEGLDATETQDKDILAFLKKNEGQGFTGCMIWKAIYTGTDVPVTSVRRSLSTLSDQGLVVKLDEKKTGIFGRPAHLWVAA